MQRYLSLVSRAVSYAYTGLSSQRRALNSAFISHLGVVTSYYESKEPRTSTSKSKEASNKLTLEANPHEAAARGMVIPGQDSHC